MNIANNMIKNKELVQKIFEICTERKYTIATAESITGGRIASAFTSLDGSSDVFTAGVVCYSEHSKVHSAGVDIRLINEVGVYHEKVVEQMAERIAKRNLADIGIATSGRVDTGKVYFGFYFKNDKNINNKSHVLSVLIDINTLNTGNIQNKKLTREEIQNLATNFSLSYVLNLL